MLNIFLQAQPNPLAPVVTLLGFIIAMVWLYTRSANKKKKAEEKNDEEKNKMQ